MFRNAMQRFFFGRYGVDRLGRALLWLGLALVVASMLLPRSYVVDWLCWVVYGVVLFRMLSRNIPARRSENDRYCRLVDGAARRRRLWRNKLRDKEHRYFTCPGCKLCLRVPRGKGRISITCRQCGCNFTKET